MLGVRLQMKQLCAVLTGMQALRPPCGGKFIGKSSTPDPGVAIHEKLRGNNFFFGGIEIWDFTDQFMEIHFQT